MRDDFRLDKEEHVDQLIQFLQRGGTVQEIYSMADADLEVMFLAASRYLQRELYREAADCFLFLTFLNPYRSRYWIGLGESERKLGNFEQAVQAYTMANMYNFEDPRPYFHAASCYLALEETRRARDHLLLAVEHSRNKDEYSSLSEVCYELIDDLNIKLEDDNQGGQ